MFFAEYLRLIGYASRSFTLTMDTYTYTGLAQPYGDARAKILRFLDQYSVLVPPAYAFFFSSPLQITIKRSTPKLSRNAAA